MVTKGWWWEGGKKKKKCCYTRHISLNVSHMHMHESGTNGRQGLMMRCEYWSWWWWCLCVFFFFFFFFFLEKKATHIELLKGIVKEEWWWWQGYVYIELWKEIQDGWMDRRMDECLWEMLRLSRAEKRGVFFTQKFYCHKKASSSCTSSSSSSSSSTLGLYYWLSLDSFWLGWYGGGRAVIVWV